MPDLFDPISIEPPAPAPPAGPPPPAPTPPLRPAGRSYEERAGLVASFACHCGNRDELLEPVPEEGAVPCWGCKRPMHRWWPTYEPPTGNARIWDGKARKR